MNFVKITFVVSLFLLINACATAPTQTIATPDQLESPTPAAGNTGEYMSPYTTDGVLAEWVDKAINAKMGSAIGSAAGAYAGRKMAEQIPFVGGLLGSKIGDSMGRQVAIKMSGGEEFIRESSDVSFDSLHDMAVWLYVNHSSHDHFQDALDSTYEIYPELRQVYFVALRNTSAQVAY